MVLHIKEQTRSQISTSLSNESFRNQIESYEKLVNIFISMSNEI